MRYYIKKISNHKFKINKKVKIIDFPIDIDYEKFFFDRRKKQCNILELGSFYGHASASLFFYFKYSTIYSGDIYPDLFRYKSERINNFFIDTSSEDSIKKTLLNKKISFDIIIEDAGHCLKDQIISLFLLFRKLNSGGLFIIEELDFPDTRKDMNINNAIKRCFRRKNIDVNLKWI